MTNTKQQFKFLAVALLAAALVFLVWGVQKVSAIFNKTAAKSESIRIVELNECSTLENNLESPSFSGCNSLI